MDNFICLSSWYISPPLLLWPYLTLVLLELLSVIPHNSLLRLKVLLCFICILKLPVNVQEYREKTEGHYAYLMSSITEQT